MSVQEQYKTVTSEVKSAINGLQIVFPATYAKIYQEYATKHNLEVKPEEMINREMLDEKLVRYIITLADCTDAALNAMQNEDKELLQTVLTKTLTLQGELFELKKIVYEDGLTKIHNRKWFDDTATENDGIHLRGQGTLVMVDLDHFKDINDSYGHIVGDKVLVYVASKLKETGGRVVRYGGDEFLIIFDKAMKQAEVVSKMEALLKHFNHAKFIYNQLSFLISFSYGLSTFNENMTIEDVISAADNSMYTNKRASK